MGAERHRIFTAFRNARRHLRLYDLRFRNPFTSSIFESTDVLTAYPTTELSSVLDHQQAESNGPAAKVKCKYISPELFPAAASQAGPLNAARSTVACTYGADCSSLYLGPNFSYGTDAVPFGRTASGSMMGPNFNYGTDAVPFGRTASGSAVGPAFFISRRADRYRELPRGLVCTALYCSIIFFGVESNGLLNQ